MPRPRQFLWFAGLWLAGVGVTEDIDKNRLQRFLNKRRQLSI